MTQFTYMAIKVANEQEFDQVAEKLLGMGYVADANPKWHTWNDQKTHVITYHNGEFGFYEHSGFNIPTRYTFTQFMEL